MDRPPAAWTEVAFLPGGDAEDKIGLDPCYHCERVTPAALAVADDGSYWIADSYKHRIAHFAGDGSFLGAMPVDSGPADLVFVGGRLYVLLEEGRPAIVPVEGDGIGEPIIANDGGKRLHVIGLVGGQHELLAVVAGAERILGSFWAMATVDLTTGQVAPAPGVRVEGGADMDLVPLLDIRPISFEVHRSDGVATSWIREVGFQLVRNGRPVRTTVGDSYLRTSTPSGAATVMSIGDGQGLSVGAWYWEIPADGGPSTFERLPFEGFIGDIRRSISVGPEGRVYGMRLLDDGLHIYRR